MILINSNREITTFNTAKNEKDESANKLTASKLITYNGIIPTKIYDKIKVTRISMAFGSATLTPKSLIEQSIFNMNQMNTARRREIKQRRTRRRITNHHI